VSRRLFRAAAFASLFLLSGCAPQAATTQGKHINSMYTVVLVLAVVIWVGVVGAILWAVVRYRRQPGDDVLPPQTHGNTTFEVIWTAVPTLIVLALFAMSYNTLRVVDKKTPVGKLGAIIEVTGIQWSWEFNYGNGVIVKKDSQKAGDIPRMVVPVGEPIRVELRSDNVIHAFYVPDFLFKRDVVPGRANAFDFTVDVPGIYKGQCAELCGTDHAKMTFEVQAVGRSTFDKWLVEQKAKAAAKACDAAPVSPVTISTTGDTLKFDQPCVSVPAGQPVPLTYQHKSGSPSHNVAVFTKDPSAGGTQLVATKIIGSGSDTVTVPAQPPGTYYFFCQVHPQMNGSYTAK
jgi:cytochrome c oxidase subunit 2